MVAFSEVADRVWVARYPWWDVNVTAVGSERGLLVVDTHASSLAAQEVIADVRRLGAGPVVGVVNTHEHFDHVFGNDAFRAAFGPMPIHAQQVAAANTVAAGERVQQAYGVDRTDPHRAEILATRIVPADDTFASTRTLDLGDRIVRLIHPGRGHTAGDLVVAVDAVVLAGDLVEESAYPSIGADAYPLDWPATLDAVMALLTDASVVVPGHGACVDHAFVRQQAADLAQIAATIRDLAAQGVPRHEALNSGTWPWPTELLRNAVARGYDQL